ncbi:MAG: glutamine-hydrolyzing carbamoyl-phosphate synthase small subunit [Bacteroidota bacterium]|nr:glutamine-hydrolyzing carbamoyl-phosphate synthase small subunit [Candidatus Kapabacteria bacterium]MDW8219481.1 glutamine-hydrolyzing carbamoyl-phosphate synthase small subunit [Bacteroidota bacterium]
MTPSQPPFLNSQPALLALENGMIFRGFAFGDVEAEAEGEVIFNTAMMGYQEALTDPSYYGQILTFTYPHIGNYGVNPYDGESGSMQAEGLIVREYSKAYSSWRATRSLAEFLQEHCKIGIEGIDTRALVRVLRSEGVMRGIISAKEKRPDALIERSRNLPSMNGLDLTEYVSCKEPFLFEEQEEPYILSTHEYRLPRKLRVAAIDYGIKKNILRRLASYGCEIMVFPSTVHADDIRAYDPDGIFLSNGPGDPAVVNIDAVREVLTEKPIFGICLGHQILGLALGAATYKMKFGHRGVNHPVKNLLTGTIEITSQNHGFAIDAASMPPEIELTHINLNDNTVSGFRHRTLPIFCVQYHPEAAPGTHDSDYLFRQFVEAMVEHRRIALAVA